MTKSKNTTKRTIVRWDTGAVLWEGDAESLGAAVTAALKAEANLTWADLTRANHLRLPTGETWIEYLTETVPALLVAGGKSLESFTESWQCHEWANCPMAHAFDTHDLSGVPLLLRPRAAQFVQFFDAKQIPWPLPRRAELEAAQAAAENTEGR